MSSRALSLVRMEQAVLGRMDTPPYSRLPVCSSSVLLVVACVLAFSLLPRSAAFGNTGTADSLLALYRAAPRDTSALRLVDRLNEALNAAGRCTEVQQFATEQLELADKLASAQAIGLKRMARLKWYMARAHGWRGVCSMKARNNTEALPELESSLLLFRELQDTTGVASALWYIGTIHLQQGDFDVALEQNLEVLELRKSLGDSVALAFSYNNIGYIRAEQGDHERALQDHLSALGIRKALGDRVGLAGTYNNLGVVHLALGNVQDAIVNYRAAHELSQALGDRAGTVKFHNNMGDIAERWGDHAKALEHYFSALATATEIKDAFAEGVIHNNIGNTLLVRGDVDDALVHFRQSLAIFERIGDRSKMALAYSAIGSCHTARKDYDSALEKHLMALEIQRAIGDRPRESKSYLKLGELHLVQGQEREALRRFRQALEVNEEVGDPLVTVDANQLIGEVLLERGDHAGAQQVLEVARSAALGAGYKKGIAAAYGALAKAYHGMGDHKRAYENHVQHAVYKDSLFNEESGKRIAELKARYEATVKDNELLLKDNELQLLNQTRALQEARIDRQRATQRYLIGGFVLFLLFAWIALRLSAQKRKAAFARRLLETEQKALRAQMNPHFIFNVLNSIQYYAGLNDMAAVETYLNKFTRLIRAILEQSRSPFIPLTQELDMLRLYLELEQMRFENKFSYTIEVDPDIDTARVRIPGMLVQPIVENAIKHGIRYKKGEAMVQVRFASRGNTLVCTVTDNGIGRDAAKDMGTSANGHDPVATAIIGERMESLSALHGIQLACVTEDLVDASGNPEGTRVSVEVPIETPL
jgi:tetratricopeptide (TPR) repeat protein